jgi:hypothetical protein
MTTTTTTSDVLTADKRSELCRAKGVTLDGQPAQISSPVWGYARVVDRNGRCIDVTWTHAADAVSRGGKFYRTQF